MPERDTAIESTIEETPPLSRRNFVGAAALATGGITALGAGVVTAQDAKESSTVPLDWNEVYYTNCPLVSASNVDQELGWTKEEYKKIGVHYAYFRSRRHGRARHRPLAGGGGVNGR